MDFWNEIKKSKREKLPECYSFLLKESDLLLSNALALSKEEHKKQMQLCKDQANRSECSMGGEVLHRGYYCPSLIRDIVTGNCNRGRIVKRMTEKAKQNISFEYGFHDDKILFAKRKDGKQIYESEYISYYGNKQIGYSYDKEMNLRAISECIYLNGKIMSYFLVYVNYDNSIDRCEKEIYEYKNGMLHSAILYLMQTSNSCDHEKYVFDHDADGFLSSYKCIEYENGVEKEDYYWKDHIFKVYKKRKV